MIEDKHTNVVFVADTLKRYKPKFYKRFLTLLDRLNINTVVVENTKDFWIRDYMPIQIEKDKFIKYKYHPDYLLNKKSDKKYITDCTPICNAYGIETIETSLIIDGGNIVPCGNNIVMTDKVFAENGKEKYDVELTQELEDVFRHEIIFLPWHATKDEPYGHADGYIKYAGENRILMSNHRDICPYEAKEIRHKLEAKGYEVTELQFNVNNPDTYLNWAYINFLQVGHHIIVPSFGIDEDAQAVEQIQSAFPYCDIHTIECNDIATDGGAIHCITWNINKH